MRLYRWRLILTSSWREHRQAQGGQNLRLPRSGKLLEKVSFRDDAAEPALQPLEKDAFAVWKFFGFFGISCGVPRVHPYPLLEREPEPFRIVVVCSSLFEIFSTSLKLFDIRWLAPLVVSQGRWDFIDVHRGDGPRDIYFTGLKHSIGHLV